MAPGRGQGIRTRARARRSLLAASAALLALLSAGPAAALVAPSDWSGYGGGPTHTGVNVQEHTLSPATAGTYRVGWTSAPIPGTGPVSQPVVWGDTVVAGRSGTVRAFDARWGAVRWSVAGAVRGLAPPVQGAAVFVLRDDHVVGLRVRDGRQVWRSADRPRIRSARGASITATADVVLVAGNGITAFDRTSGAVRWTFADDVAWSAPSVRGGVAVSVRNGVGVAAFDVHTGARLWLTTSPGASSGLDGFPVAFGADRLVVSSAYDALVSLDPLTGRERWRGVPGHLSVGWTVRQLALTGSTAYFVDRVDDERFDAITAVRATDGVPLWSSTVGPRPTLHDQPLGVALAGGVLAFTLPSTTGPTHLLLLAASTGRRLLDLALPGGGDRPPSVSRGQVLVGTRDRLVAVRPSAAAPAQELTAGPGWR